MNYNVSDIPGEVVKGQAEADEESSLKERVSMGVGKAVGEVG